MKFKELEKLFEAGKEAELRQCTPRDLWMIRLYLEVYGSLDSVAADLKAIRKMLESQIGKK